MVASRYSVVFRLRLRFTPKWYSVLPLSPLSKTEFWFRSKMDSAPLQQNGQFWHKNFSYSFGGFASQSSFFLRKTNDPRLCALLSSYLTTELWPKNNPSCQFSKWPFHFPLCLFFHTWIVIYDKLGTNIKYVTCCVNSWLDSWFILTTLYILFVRQIRSTGKTSVCTSHYM